MQGANPLTLLSSIIVCASCAPQQTCIPCSLSCDGAPELKEHDSVIVLIGSPLQKDLEKVYSVSSLYDGGHCSVPGCFHRDTPYALEIYLEYNDTVAEVFLDKSNLLPVCGPEGIAGRKNPNGVDVILCNKLVILLAFCFWLIFHLKGPG
ncbi:hypothetical protein QQF64_012974 [Cirrhinus molitorella]|uniref:Uncharacterized protein n=1 Tax=Cirrhinus molitorella TaxID=172907 RepID=A0ABR3LTY3_9TELE